MLTFRDYKVKAKKILCILNISFFPRIVAGTYEYKGYAIYENLYASNDFYYRTPDHEWIVHGSYRQLTRSIDRELTSPPIKIHARHTPPPPEVKFYARNTPPSQKEIDRLAREERLASIKATDREMLGKSTINIINENSN